VAAASRILPSHLRGWSAGSSYTARYDPGRFASSNPPDREEVKSMTHLKTRMARTAWTLASLAALAAALGAGRKWA
jgi:hypothetical protein